MRNKVAIYTAATKDFSVIHDPSIVSEYCDYICFTDQSALESSIWQTRPFPENGLDSHRKEKQIKVLSHLLLPEYAYTIWIDNTVEMVSSMDDLIEETLFRGDFDMYAFTHPQNDSVYTEAESLMKFNIDRKETVTFQMNQYKEQLYPEHNGLSDTSILLRNNHSPQLNSIMNQWWEEIATYSFIDQLSFDYITWKNECTVGVLTDSLSSANFFNHHNEQYLVS